MFIIGDLEKFNNEKFKKLNGLYSHFDSRILYNFIRYNNPKNILEIGPREGRTTSVILEAIIKNLTEYGGEINYFLFEKDIPYLNAIKDYINGLKKRIGKSGGKINFYFDSNIIDSKNLDLITKLDFLFIDANHDYILSKYFFDTLVPKLKIGGYMHFHDMYVNRNGNGLLDMTMEYDKQTHPDVLDYNVIRGLYPTLYEKYKENEPVNKFEGDIVYEYMVKNNSEYFSTQEYTKANKLIEDPETELKLALVYNILSTKNKFLREVAKLVLKLKKSSGLRNCSLYILKK